MQSPQNLLRVVVSETSVSFSSVEDSNSNSGSSNSLPNRPSSVPKLKLPSNSHSGKRLNTPRLLTGDDWENQKHLLNSHSFPKIHLNSRSTESQDGTLDEYSNSIFDEDSTLQGFQDLSDSFYDLDDQPTDSNPFEEDSIPRCKIVNISKTLDANMKFNQPDSDQEYDFFVCFFFLQILLMRFIFMYFYSDL